MRDRAKPLTRAASLLLPICLALACGPGPERDPRAASTGRSISFEENVGWYEIAPGLRGLLTYSATGGLMLFVLEDTLVADRLVPSADGTLRWITRSGAERRVELSSGSDPGFAWTDEAGGRGRAARLGCAGYEPRELEYVNGAVALSATLFVPCSGRPEAAAVLIHGSGASTRDNAWYMMIADRLARDGVAVLLPDKRGSGKSSGDWTTSSFAELAGDAAAGVDAVGRALRMQKESVGVVGLSQGGRIAPMVPELRPEVGFVVNVSGAAVTLDLQIEHETAQTLRQSGWPGVLHPVVRPIAVTIAKWRRPGWWRLNGGVDPVPYWAALDRPGLVVYGADDEMDNVPVAESVRRIRELENPCIGVHVYDGSGHALYAPGTRWVRGDFLDLLSGWIRSRAGGPGSEC